MPGGNAWYAASVVDSFTFSFGADDGSPADPRRDGFGEGAPVANPLEGALRQEISDSRSYDSAEGRDTVSKDGPGRGQTRSFDRDDSGFAAASNTVTASDKYVYVGQNTAWKSDIGVDAGPELSLAFTPTDDLFVDQWHLLNTGQGNGVVGLNINVTGVWDDYTGTGIRVGVVDDGVQYTHHDLDDNYNTSGQFDYGGDDTDPFPTTSDPHGTAVAGLIAAENNGVGSVGVAFDASVTAFRIFGGSVTEAEFADVYDRHAIELDVSNNSWGFNGFFFDDLDGTDFDSVGLAIENAAANGRGGLGTVMLWAAPLCQHH